VFEHMFDLHLSMPPASLKRHAIAVARASARAEHEKWATVLELHEHMVADIESDTTSIFRRTAINAAALEIAQLLRISEQQVWRIVEQAERLRDRAPRIWAAFGEGRFDAQKASTLAAAVERCAEPETVAALEEPAVDYAAKHTNAELRRWVDKLIDRLEHIEREQADVERDKRFVDVRHARNGMSEVTAWIPTPAAVAIRKRLRAAARELDDTRTRAQKEADVFCSWLTNATGTECDITAEIAVLVEAKALAGVTDVPAHVLDIDDDVPIPTAWVFELAEAQSTLWTRLLTDDLGHVLDVTRIGYQPPESLRRAVRWRDRRCRVSGCSKPAESTDLDHRVPFDDGGATSGSNLWCLCRRHHAIKGHGLMPPDAYDPPEVHLVRLPTPPLLIDYVPAA